MKGGLNVANLIDAAKSGDKYETLIALRDILASTIQNCESGRDMASNTKRLMEVITEIEAMDAEKAAEEARLEAEKNAKVSKHNRLKRKIEER